MVKNPPGHVNREGRIVLPDKGAVFEGPFTSFWFSETGILYARSKNVPRTLETQKETFALVRKMSGGKKVCMLVDITRLSPMDKATRDHVAKELPNYVTAIAAMSNSILGRTLGNLFVALKGMPVPSKFFTDEKAALEWLKQYL